MDVLECFLHALRLHWYARGLAFAACLCMLVYRVPVGPRVAWCSRVQRTLPLLRCCCRVEFQNKFYKADGYKFQPFDFAAILTAPR